MRLIFAALALLIAVPALAHYSDEWKDLTAEQRAWFRGLHDANGTTCCDDADGHHIANADWDASYCRPRNASIGDLICQYRVRLSGRWNLVPDDAVISNKNLTGSAVVWPMPDSSSPDGYMHDAATGDVRIRCFLPGPGA